MKPSMGWQSSSLLTMNSTLYFRLVLGFVTERLLFSSPGMNVLGKLMPYPRRRCRRRRCRRHRQFQVKVSVY